MIARRPVAFLIAWCVALASAAPAQAQTLCADITAWPFGSAERMVPTEPALTKAHDFLRGIVAKPFPYPEGWRARIRAEPAKPAINRLLTISALVNGVKFAPDATGDLWKSPARFLKEGGDCEDQAIAKYALLRDNGFKARDLRLTVVRIRAQKGLHMILVARTGPTPFETLVLDNAKGGPRTALYCEEMTPLMSLNENAAWAHAPEGEVLIRSLGHVCTTEP